MAAYIARRLLLAFFTVWVISVAAFVIIELPPGDTIDRMFDRTTRTHGEAVAIEMLEALRLTLGLDEPKYVRYGKWMWALLQGDLGQTMVPYGGLGNQRAVKEVIGDRLFTTIALTGFTVLVTWTFAIPVGIYSAVRQHSVGDYLFTFVGFSGLAVPDFLLGLVMMYIAFAYFDQSVGGLFSADYAGTSWLDGGVNWGKVFDMINHLWVPAIVLGTSGTAGLIRVMRNNLLDELGKPYVVTARAKGLSPLRLVLKYPVRVAVNPLVSTVGYLLPSLVSGSVIVSVVLSLPTIGPVLLEAIRIEDIYVAGFVVFVLGVLTVIGTLLSDIALAFVDPRIRLDTA
jgi:peptide/nickel transport system permease protein